MEEKVLSHKINLIERKQINISGVEKVLNSNNNSIVLKLSDTNLEILGVDLSILSFSNNLIEISGNLDILKYSKQCKKKDNLIKRIFK